MAARVSRPAEDSRFLRSIWSSLRTSRSWAGLVAKSQPPPARMTWTPRPPASPSRTSPSTAAWISSAGTPSRTVWRSASVTGSWETKMRDSTRAFKASLMGGRPVRVLAQPDADRLEELVLDGHGHPGLDQLENAEKGDQGLLERLGGLEVFEEIEHVALLEEGYELLHLDLDRDLPAADDPGVVGLPPLHHAEEGLGQVEKRELDRLELALAGEGRDEVALPLQDLDVFPLAEDRAGGPDLLVLEEPVDEDPPGVLGLGEIGLAGQQHLRFDVDEERGDEDELGLAVEVDLGL